MYLDGRWVAFAIAVLALIAPGWAWSADAPVLRVAVTADVKTAAVFADADDVVIRGGFTEVGVRRGDVVVADRSGVREIVAGPVVSAAVLSDRIAFALPGRLVVDRHGRRRTVRAPWRGSFDRLLRCGPWVCFVSGRTGRRLEIGAVDRGGRLRWRRVVTGGGLVVADDATLVVARGRRLARYARRYGRSHGTVTLRASPVAVALAPGRIYAAEPRAGRVRVEAYARASAARVATSRSRWTARLPA